MHERHFRVLHLILLPVFVLLLVVLALDDNDLVDGLDGQLVWGELLDVQEHLELAGIFAKFADTALLPRIQSAWN